MWWPTYLFFLFFVFFFIFFVFVFFFVCNFVSLFVLKLVCLFTIKCIKVITVYKARLCNLLLEYAEDTKTSFYIQCGGRSSTVTAVAALHEMQPRNGSTLPALPALPACFTQWLHHPQVHCEAGSRGPSVAAPPAALHSSLGEA